MCYFFEKAKFYFVGNKNCEAKIINLTFDNKVLVKFLEKKTTFATIKQLEKKS